MRVMCWSFRAGDGQQGRRGGRPDHWCPAQPIVVSTTACALTLYDGSRVAYVTGRVGLGQRGAEDVAAQRRRVVDDGERAGGKVRVRVSSDSLWTHGCHIGRAPFVISTDDAGEET